MLKIYIYLTRFLFSYALCKCECSTVFVTYPLSLVWQVSDYLAEWRKKRDSAKVKVKEFIWIICFEHYILARWKQALFLGSQMKTTSVIFTSSHISFLFSFHFMSASSFLLNIIFYICCCDLRLYCVSVFVFMNHRHILSFSHHKFLIQGWHLQCPII